MADYGLLAPAWLLALPLAGLLPWWMGGRGLGLPSLVAPLPVRHPGAADGLPGPAAPSGPGSGRWVLLPAVALFCLALAEPVRYGQPLAQGPAPLDLVLLVDVSVSMTLRDYELDGQRVDRLKVAKRLLDRFAVDFAGRRLGLVVVGRPSAVWTPLTADRELVRHLLGRFEPTMAGRNAAIGDALALAAARFAEKPPPVVVLISDGGYPAGRLSPAEGAARLVEAGMTLYTLAVGAQAPSAGEQGLSDLIFAPVDVRMLEEIAAQTGGSGFHVMDAGDMAEALTWVESTHRALSPAPAAPRRREPLYHWPLLLALLMLAAWPWWAESARTRRR
jgi:Ca-activated chloride channel homolog